MAHEDEIHFDHYPEFFINELYAAFNDLIDDHKVLKRKNKELKALNETLGERLNQVTKEKDHLSKEDQKAKSEKIELGKLNDNLENISTNGHCLIATNAKINEMN